MRTYVLGIGGYFHDASACILCDGKLVAAAEEERFTRLKHQPGFPHKAIDYCLTEAGITIHEIDHIAFYMSLTLGLPSRIWHHVKSLPKYPTYSIGYIIEQLYRRGWAWFELKRLRGMGGNRAQMHYVPHHLSHASSSFHVSPFDESAILVLDGLGEWTTTTFARGKGGKIAKLKEVKYPHSLGGVYGSVTNYLGFKTGDEYKVMGLSSFGKPQYLEEMRDLVILRDDGLFRLNLPFFTFYNQPGRYEGYVSQRFIDRFGPPRKSGEPIEQRHKDMAASVQALLEEVAVHMTRYLQKSTGSSNLCIAGGVALNSVMNHRLWKESRFENVFIQPAANDGGLSLGAAFYTFNGRLDQPRQFVQEHAYWGPGYSNSDILALLKEAKTEYTRIDSPSKVAADLIAQGKIVGWFQGRMEWGPRALGNRSILADPTRGDMTDIINKYVKHREDFRPFAPSILEEYGEEYFRNYHSSPYMLEVFEATQKAKDSIPAVVHVDGTCRIQTVVRNVNPLYWELIEEFRKQRGVPVILNTSFNVRGEPIVNSPREALRCFFSTGIDALVIGNYVIEKRWNPRNADSLAPDAVADLDVLIG